mmetsp:Transcript_38879/g.117426  ORF Transcript_38879/g.117426 Transcript_38879/m.117426 type:complete len:339 (+) Transcript_38879:289-1305(+)
MTRPQQRRFLESLEDGAGRFRFGGKLEVQLRQRPGRHVADILHAHLETHCTWRRMGVARNVGQAGILKIGEGQAVAKREGRLECAIPVTRLQALRINDLASRAGRDGIGLRLGDHQGQPPLGGDLAEDDIGPRVARLLPAEEHDQNAVDNGLPRHQHRPRSLHKHDGPPDSCDCFDQLVRVAVQGQVLSIPRFAAGRRRHDDRYVGHIGGVDALVDMVAQGTHNLEAQLGCHAAEALKGRDDGAGKVPAAAARIIVPCRPVSIALPLAVHVEGRRIRRLPDDGDAFRGLGADWRSDERIRRAGHGDGLVFERQEAARVLKQDNRPRRRAPRQCDVLRR